MTTRSRVSKLNKADTGFRELQVNTPERNKLLVIRKIIMISSIKKEVKKLLNKIIDFGVTFFNEQQSKTLLEEAKTILDNDKQKELGKDLDRILENKDVIMVVTEENKELNEKAKRILDDAKIDIEKEPSKEQQNQARKLLKEIIKILNNLSNVKDSVEASQQSRFLLDKASVLLYGHKFNELEEIVQRIIENKSKVIPVSEQILKLIQYFIISPSEKAYILKIQKEMKEDEELDYQIKKIEKDINEEKENKLKVYEKQKTGTFLGMSTKVINRKKEIDNFQNKLMRSNQKLNELYANNNKLRDKISQLRKQKNAMETIYNKLKKQLDKKNENVENTIKYANDANKARVKAEKDLKNLKEEAQSKKEQFKQECLKLNNEIQHDIRFKQFIKSKQIEKEQLDQLEQQIKINQKTIEAKKQSNEKIDHQYRKSIAKEQQIKKAFDNIKKEIGIGNVASQNEGRQLLNVFINLYEKNAIMNTFVEELTKQVEELQNKIAVKKKEIQQMYLRGSADQCEKDKLNEDLKKKVEYQKRKKQILDDQYQKSVETLTIIKEYLEEIFQEINIDPQVIEKLKNCNINEDNLTEFLGELEKKGLEAISHYGKLVGEQLKAQKGNSWEIQKQIDDLNNIITLENVNSMNNPGPTKTIDYPSELLIKVKDEKIKEQDEKPLSLQEFKKFAIESLENFSKNKIGGRPPPKNAKYTAVSHQNSLKMKKKNKENVQAK